ncbi:MAG: type II secretion system protein [Alphaproteobacteria bacterium]
MNIPRAEHLSPPPPAKFNHFNRPVMMRHALVKMSPRRAGRFYLSLRERSSRRSASVGGRVRAFFSPDPSPHPASAARLLTSPEGRGKKAGFSLVELSIVLVILGLLVGGILAGQSLIRAAELRSIATDYQRYTTATQTFRDKYFALPGDMPDATAFWGTDPGGCPGTNATPSVDARTCSGDGDGNIDGDGSEANFEGFRYFQHLANAGLIEGKYTGVSASAVNGFSGVIGQNLPISKLSNASFYVLWRNPSFVGNATEFAGNHGNSMFFGSIASATSHPGAAVMRPEEVWNIDVKLDDGRPGYGSVLTRQYATCADASSASDFDCDYRLDVTTISCGVHFRRMF